MGGGGASHEVDDGAGAALGQLRAHRIDGVLGGAVDGVAGARRQGRLALRRIDVGDDDTGLDQRRRQVHGVEADAAGADHHDAIVGAQRCHFLERRIGGQARARVGAGDVVVYAVVVDQVARVRHNHVVAVAAVGACAEETLGAAQVLVALRADLAFAAAHPGIDDALVADGGALGLWPHRDHLADDFVAEREGKLHAAINDHDLVATAKIEITVPDVQIRMADAAGVDADQDLGAVGLGVGIVVGGEWSTEFDDLFAVHVFFFPGAVVFRSGR